MMQANLTLNAFRLHYEYMSVVLTIRDVPDEVRDLLSQQARERGQSLQAFLLAMLRRQASFGRNRQIVAELDLDLQAGGGAGGDAPNAAEVLEQARRQGAAIPDWAADRGTHDAA
jgi:hypothetical protein